MTSYQLASGPVHLFRIPTGADLYQTITDFAVDNDISTASLTFLGAVRKAALRYMDQDTKQYVDFEIDEPLEILAGVGNVSLLDGRPFLHAHAVLSRENGEAVGGHLNVGTEVFVAEVTMWELLGDAVQRLPDQVTGLPLWLSLGD